MIGVDEVGRGCLAGPLLVVAARVKSNLPKGVKDSKLLTRSQREGLFPSLLEACEFGEGWVSAVEIGKLGLAGSLKLATERALQGLVLDPGEEVIMDGSVNYLPKQVTNGRVMVKADQLVPAVSAASIIAKVKRDSYMVELSKKYPNYSFEDHVGYGTKRHLAAIKTYGPLELVHRLNFAPFRGPL